MHNFRFNFKRTSSHKRRWGTLIEAAKAGRVSRLIGRSRSEDSVCNSNCGQDHSHSNSPPSEENATESPSDSNPSLDQAGNEHVEEHHTQPQPPPHHHEHHEVTGHVLGALAALRRKRKKFSDSRKQGVEAQEVVCVVGKNNSKKVLHNYFFKLQKIMYKLFF